MATFAGSACSEWTFGEDNRESLAADAVSLDDNTRWRAQWRLKDIKDDKLIPVMLASLEVEGKRTEERIAEARAKRSWVRNAHLPTCNLVNTLKAVGGKDVVPDLKAFIKKYPRFASQIEEDIFELENDITKPIRAQNLQIFLRPVLKDGPSCLVGYHKTKEALELFEGDGKANRYRKVETFPQDGILHVCFEIFCVDEPEDVLRAYAYDLLLDGKRLRRHGPYVHRGNVSTRSLVGPLRDLSQGKHTLMVQIIGVGNSCSADFHVAGDSQAEGGPGVEKE